MKDPVRLLLLAARLLLGVGLFWLVAGKMGGWNLAVPLLSSWEILLPVVAFSLFGAFVEALRLNTLLRAQGVSITLSQSFQLVTVAFSFNFCVPGGSTGDFSKLYYLGAGRNGKGWELATVVFVDRLVGLLSMLLLILLLGATSWSLVESSPVLFLLFWTAAIVVAAILLFAGLCLFPEPSLRSFLRRIVSVMPFRRHLERITNALFHYGNHRGAVARSICFSFVGNLAAAAVFIVLGRALYPTAVFLTPALLSMFGMFANAVTITPGGLGVGEAAFDRLFAEAGLPGGAAMMIVWRVGMLPLCLLGLGFYFGGLRIDTQDAQGGSEEKSGVSGVTDRIERMKA